jgi:hypothetical protein
VGHKLVSDVIFVLEIKVKSALCHACLINDIGYGCFAEALCSEKIKGGFQQCIFFQFLVYIYFSHKFSPLPVGEVCPNVEK